MLQRKLERKGLPRSFSNASYFHGNGALLPTTTGNKTSTNDARSKSPRRIGSGGGGGGSSYASSYNSSSVAGAIGSISLLSVGKLISVGFILFVAVSILRKVVFDDSAATEELFDAKVSAEAVVDSGGNGPAGGLRSAQYWSTLEEQKLPLSQFPSIQYALDHSDIVLLYFAASWCKMSTPITELLDEKFADILLPPVPNDATTTTKKILNAIQKQRRPVSLVYVSSDETEEQMKNYARKHWSTVPFDTDERANLKRHFQVAAKREMEALEMEQRLYEIPAIIIVSGESHNVVTTHGVEDLKERGSEALIHWMKLLHTVKALEDKFY